MTEKEKLALLEDMFEMDEGTLKAETELNAIENWDSMAVLSLFVIVEENFGKTLKTNDVKNFENVRDILDFMG